MRGLTVRPFLLFVAALLLFPWAMRSNAQVTLGWTASTDPSVAGYYLVWGTSSGNYTSTITNSASTTSAQVTNLIANQVYYFNISAFNSSGGTSPYAGEVVYTNTSSSPATNQPANGETQTNSTTTTTTLSIFAAVTNGPPAPTGSGGSATTTSGNGGSGTATTSASTAGTNTAANFWGVPPRLTLVVSNGEPTMNIGGTIGADLTIQSSTNIFAPDSWQTVTNVSMTNAAPLPQGSQPQDALDIAFVPAAESVPVSQTEPASGPVTYYRAFMPYDYVILAGNVLTGQGYRPRMVLVNMPGIVCDDACYVTEGSSFIHYDRSSYALQLQGSGPTLRAIATKLSSTLGLDWTSASEFTYSNGIAQIVSTVVQTEPASSDPAPGQNNAKTSTRIDF